MDSQTSTDVFQVEMKSSQENTLLEIIKEICSESNNNLPKQLRGKICRIIADCDLTHHSSLHKLNTTDESSSTLLGFMHQAAAELTFDEQSELNQAIVQKIQKKIPQLTTELESLKDAQDNKQTRKEQMKELQDNISDKLDVLEQQENEKVELMMEWLNFRINEVNKFSDESSELLTLKTKILDLKSKILHLHILQNIFTETTQSIKAYTEIRNDLKDSIKETEQRIKHYKEVIDSDYK